MKTMLIAICSVFCLTSAHAAIQTRTIEYKSGDAALKGYLAWNDAIKGRSPGVLVVHEWWGNNDYAQRRARELAELGYVALAVDMYGDGKTTNDAKVAQTWSSAVTGDNALLRQRAEAALEVLKSQPNVDPARIGAIGYCFGGKVVLEMARASLGLAGVVSFHGGLMTPHPEQTKDVKTRILVCNGADDQFVSAEEIATFEKEMKSAGANYRIISYPGAQHSFTNPAADSYKIPSVKYDAAADRKSWQDMKQFFADVFGG